MAIHVHSERNLKLTFQSRVLKSKFKITIILILGAMNNIFHKFNVHSGKNVCEYNAGRWDVCMYLFACVHVCFVKKNACMHWCALCTNITHFLLL